MFCVFFLIKMVTLPIQLVICLIDSLGMLRRGHDHIHMAHTLIATEKEVEGFAQLLHRLVVPWLFRWPPPFIYVHLLCLLLAGHAGITTNEPNQLPPSKAEQCC